MHHHIWASQQMRKCRCKAMQMHCKKCVGLSECCNHHGRVTLGSAPSGIWTPCSSACSHGAQICGGDVKQRSRHAESRIAGTAGQSSHWMPGTRTKGTGKQGTHERFAGRMGDQRNLEKWCRTVWGPRYVNKAPSGMRGWAKGCARASIGTCRMPSPQCDLTTAFQLTCMLRLYV
jgi:hypothetical protein